MIFGIGDLKPSAEPMKGISIRGYNADIDGTLEDVWEKGGVFAGFIAAAKQLKVASSSAQDAAGGTGCKSVIVEGLDSEFREISEVITLTGQTPATSVQSFLRVNSMKCYEPGSGSTAYENAGIIAAGNADSTFAAGEITVGPTLAYIAAGSGIALQGFFTVPKGFVFLFAMLRAIQRNATTSDVRLFVRYKLPGGIWRLLEIAPIQLATWQDQRACFLEDSEGLPEGTDIRINAISITGTNVELEALLQGILLRVNTL